MLGPKQYKYAEPIKQAILSDSSLSWRQYQEFKDECSSRKVKIRYLCEDCGCEVNSNFKQLNKRTMLNSATCSKCSRVRMFADKRWLKANSDAQFVAQNKPEQKKKNGERVSKYFKENPEAIKSRVEKVRAFYQTAEGKETLKNRKTHNGRGISGNFKTRFGSLQFDSSYELAFLAYMNENHNVKDIQRGEIVPYRFEEKNRNYHMDFTVVFLDGSVKWYEIKSKYIATVRRNIEELRAKLKAAKALAEIRGVAELVLVHESNAEKIIGRTFPRGHQRKQMFDLLGDNVEFANLKHREIYCG